MLYERACRNLEKVKKFALYFAARVPEFLQLAKCHQ